MKRRAILAGIAALLAPRSLIAQTPSHDGPRRLGVLMGNLADDPVGQTRHLADARPSRPRLARGRKFAD